MKLLVTTVVYLNLLFSFSLIDTRTALQNTELLGQIIYEEDSIQLEALNAFISAKLNLSKEEILSAVIYVLQFYRLPLRPGADPGCDLNVDSATDSKLQSVRIYFSLTFL